MDTTQILKYIPLLIPIVLLQWGLTIAALVDLKRRIKTHGPRWAWAVGLILTAFTIPTGIIVSGIYLAWGRHIEA
jgi:hypothetical protein